jgi:EAL domain-containing protein (putative c-di-GMP-specific phosphodiesterase class I)
MQFMRPDFTQILTEVLANSGFPPELLELEITEGIFIRDLNLAVARIRELQRLGLSIALDDFGTGYSSLSYLQRMPIDAVKLDRSFVSDLTTDAGHGEHGALGAVDGRSAPFARGHGRRGDRRAVADPALAGMR